MDILSLAFPSSSLFFFCISGGKCLACSVTHNLLMSKDGRYGSSQTRRGKGGGGECQVKADASAVFGKSHQIPTRDMLVIKTNKKRTDVCINQNMAEHQWWAALWRFSPRSEYTCGGQRGGGLSQLHAGAPLSEICLSSSFLFSTKRLWLDIRLRRSIPLQTAGWPTSMLHIVKLLIKGLHA